MDGVIRIICLAITMTAVVLVIDTLKNKRPNAEDAGQTATCYTLKAPAVLKNVGAITACVGAFLFVLFLVFMLRGNESATVGHLCVALALAGVGLFIWLWREWACSSGFGRLGGRLKWMASRSRSTNSSGNTDHLFSGSRGRKSTKRAKLSCMARTVKDS